MIKDNNFIMTTWDYKYVNGKLVVSKPREIKIPINDILVANGFEPIKENNNVEVELEKEIDELKNVNVHNKPKKKKRWGF